MTDSPAAHTFWEHVAALRAHVLWGAFFFIAAATAIFTYASGPLIALLLAPLHGQQLVFLSPLDPFFFTLRISIYAGIAVSLPLWLGLFLHFVYPALPKRRLSVLAAFVILSLLLSAAAVVIAYEYFVPVTFKFLSGFLIPGTAYMLSANSYLSFILLEIAVIFLILHLPLILNVLA